jgi:RNA polymerase-binding transcription factor DksA
MDPTFIEQQKQRLLTLREELATDLQELQEYTRQGLAPSEVQNQEEITVINTQRQLDMAGSNLFADRLYDIDRALQAIDEGAYGICERCGRPIPPERLEAIPEARFCLADQQVLENEV